MKLANEFKQAQSRQDVVDLINKGGVTSYDENEIAGQYAVDMSEGQGDISSENLAEHLTVLINSGAEFNHSEALQFAIRFAYDRNDKPTPEQIYKTRTEACLTQTQAAALIHKGCRAWQQYEAGDRKMDLAYWELFTHKIKSCPGIT